MNITVFSRGSGAHRALTRSELERRLAAAEKQAAQLNAENDELVCQVQLAKTSIYGLVNELQAQAGMAARQQNTIDRQAADIARLRQAVISARPRITVAPAVLDRPYGAAVPVSYPALVGRSTATEESPELPLDLRRVA